MYRTCNSRRKCEIFVSYTCSSCQKGETTLSAHIQINNRKTDIESIQLIQS